MTHPPTGPLDPDARVVIDRLNALNAPGYETMPPQTARAIAAHLRRNAAYPTVKVGAVRDFDLASDARPLRARHYRPLMQQTGSAPALVYFHGGGWTLGGLDTMDHLCRALVRQAGVDIVSVEYPLAPESRFTATVAVCAGAVRKIFAMAGELGLDPGRVALGGDSAGGNLAAVLALTARDGGLPAVRAQCLIYPALDLRRSTVVSGVTNSTLFMRPETMDWFTGNYLGPGGDASDWRASPLLANDLTGLPPSYVLTAGHDVLRVQGLDYVARLKSAGVLVIGRDYPGQIHNFIAMPYAIPTAHAAIADIAEFLVEYLCGQTGV
ncbi:MAG: alpha/beta hydrolase [bacterium]